MDIPKYRSHFHLLFVDASSKVGGKLSYFSSEKKELGLFGVCRGLYYP